MSEEIQETVKEKKTKIRNGEFLVWVTMPKDVRDILRGRAARDGLPMSEFCRRVIFEALKT